MGRYPALFRKIGGNVLDPSKNGLADYFAAYIAPAPSLWLASQVIVQVSVKVMVRRVCLFMRSV